MSSPWAATAASALATGILAVLSTFHCLQSLVQNLGYCFSSCVRKPAISFFAARHDLVHFGTSDKFSQCVDQDRKPPSSLNCLEGALFLASLPTAGPCGCPIRQPNNYKNLHRAFSKSVIVNFQWSALEANRLAVHKS